MTKQIYQNNTIESLHNMMTVKKTYEFNPETDLIGKGGFGKVYKAQDVNLDMVVAIKKYTGDLPAKYSLFEEIKRVIQLNHPNLVRYYDAFELEEASMFGDRTQVGVMEYINGGDLTGFIKSNPSEALLTSVFEGIMHGLKYLHSKNIIHRDLKPENILIKKENGKLIPKIADFGISKVLDEGRGDSSLVIGSIEYMAPEQFNIVRYGNQRQLHTNLDLWSLGSIIYEAFSGETPFGKTKQGFSRDEIMRNILEKDLTDIDKVPEPFRQIVRRCLVRKADDRAQNVDELLTILYGGEAYHETSSGFTAGPVTNVLDNSNHTAILPNNQQHTPRPNKGNVSPKGGKHTPQKPIFKDGFRLVYLLPFITAIASHTFFNSKVALFGNPVPKYILFSAVFCAAMMIVNTFGIFSRKIKDFEWSSWLISYGVAGYYLGASILIFIFGNIDGIIFNFEKHSFAKIFPLVVIGALTLLMLFRITKLKWAEVLVNYIGYFFFTFLLAGVLIAVPSWQTLVGVLGLFSVAGAGFLFWQSKRKTT